MISFPQWMRYLIINNLWAQTDVQVVLRTEGETEVRILGIGASRETDPEREEKVHSACTCQSQSNFNHIRDSLGASVTGGFPPYTLQVVYDRMLAWMEPSSTYPDGQLALVGQLMGSFMLILFLHHSLVEAQGKRCVRRPAETLQGKREGQGFPHISPSTFSQHHPQELLWHPRIGKPIRACVTAAWRGGFWVPSFYPSCYLNGHFQQKHQEQGQEEPTSTGLREKVKIHVH